MALDTRTTAHKGNERLISICLCVCLWVFFQTCNNNSNWTQSSKQGLVGGKKEQKDNEQRPTPSFLKVAHGALKTRTHNGYIVDELSFVFSI